MVTVPDIFEKFGGPTAVAAALEVRTSTASEMKRRGSIPVKHWPKLIDAARERGIEGVSADTLTRIHAGEVA